MTEKRTGPSLRNWDRLRRDPEVTGARSLNAAEGPENSTTKCDPLSLAECGLLCNTGLTATEGGDSESEQVSGAAGRKMAHHREQ